MLAQILVDVCAKTWFIPFIVASIKRAPGIVAKHYTTTLSYAQASGTYKTKYMQRWIIIHSLRPLKSTDRVRIMFLVDLPTFVVDLSLSWWKGVKIQKIFWGTPSADPARSLGLRILCLDLRVLGNASLRDTGQHINNVGIIPTLYCRYNTVRPSLPILKKCWWFGYTLE